MKGGQGGDGPPTFGTQMVGAPVGLKKGPSLLARKILYCHLFEASGANRMIKWTHEGPKRLCGIDLMSLRPKNKIKWAHQKVQGVNRPNYGC